MKNISVFFIFTIFGCVSVPRGFFPISEDDIFFEIQKNVNQTCLEKESGSFLGKLTLPKTPPLTLEGIWKDKFTVLHAALLTPLHEEIARFELKNHKSKVTSNSIDESELKDLTDLLEDLGSENLRKIMCGLQGLQSAEKIYKNESVYYLENSIMLASGTLKAKTIVNLLSDGVREKMEFSKGWIGSKALRWEGTRSGDNLIPVQLSFDSVLTLNISEFE